MLNLVWVARDATNNVVSTPEVPIHWDTIQVPSERVNPTTDGLTIVVDQMLLIDEVELGMVV